MKVEILSQMAGDHGTFLPGSVADVPPHVARQLVHRHHARAIDPLPEPTEDEIIPEDLKLSSKRKAKTVFVAADGTGEVK